MAETPLEALAYLEGENCGDQPDVVGPDQLLVLGKSKGYMRRLSTLRRHLEPQWTQTVPTERGWYWWWGNHTCPPCCMLVVMMNDELMLVDPIHEETHPLADCKHTLAWWCPANIPHPPLPAPATANQE